jgi:hypothetical protein
VINVRKNRNTTPQKTACINGVRHNKNRYFQFLFFNTWKEAYRAIHVAVTNLTPQISLILLCMINITASKNTRKLLLNARSPVKKRKVLSMKNEHIMPKTMNMIW